VNGWERSTNRADHRRKTLLNDTPAGDDPKMRRRPLAFLALVVAALAPPFTAASCSCGDSATGATGGAFPTGSGGAGGLGNNGGNGGGGSTGVFMHDSGGCSNGDKCGDGGVCAGGKCCADAASACADACCNHGEVCSFQKCVTPGSDCHDSTDCPDGDYCEYSLGDNTDAGAPDGACLGGASQLNGKCLPKPPICAPDAGTSDGGLDCLEACEFHPTGNFNPVLKASWGGDLASPFNTDIMMTPIVIELDDDDCDGKVTEKDIPEIVFTTFQNGAYSSAGTLHAISLINGVFVDKWSVPGIVNGTKQIAAGDFDGQPGNEVVACGEDGKVYAFKGVDGTVLWSSATALTCMMPSIADLDGDGHPEVIVEGGILDGATGALKAAFNPTLDTSFVVSDIDGDGKLDIVTASRGYHADGTVFVDTMIANQTQFYGTQDWKSSWPAVADFDGDGKPEVVVIDNLNHAISVWRYDASQPNKFVSVRAPIDINNGLTNNCGGWGATHGGGPPTVADFNGDGVPDVGTASGIGYVVFDGKKLVDPNVMPDQTRVWFTATHDCSSASTGSSVFDFDGDGKAEVVYSDEQFLRIYDGTNGSVLFQTCNTTATLIEYPLIADVDNDGHADIIVVSNAYAETCPTDGSRQAGINVYGDANGTWVRTRRVWNEHAYHITNVNEDGTIPKHELSNWTQPGLNNFRQNKQPGSEFAAPDAIVSLAPVCTGEYALVATVRNIGEAALPAGVVVGFYEGNPPGGTKLGQGTTTKILYPAESEEVVLPIMNPDQAILDGTKKVYAVVDDTMVPHPGWTECRTDNDTSAAVSGSCGHPK
jgi:FG-GAP-like repeat